VIDEESPLHGLTPETVAMGDMRLIVTVTGLDATFATTIHARRLYHAEDIAWNMRFADVISTTPSGQLLLDFGKFHDVLPL
jgi:inward rectifier potassium channel